MLTRLAQVVNAATESLAAFDYTPALEKSESFFWFFCDDYLELIKARRYGDHGEAGAASANSAMLLALSTLLRLFAPFLPFVTEEVWSWWQADSVHRAAWPVADELLRPIGGADEKAAEALVEGLPRARRSAQEEIRGEEAAAHARGVRDHPRAQAQSGSARSGVARRQRVRRVSSRRRGRKSPRRSKASMNSASPKLDPSCYRLLVRQALAEDIGTGDITTNAIVGQTDRARGVFLAKCSAHACRVRRGARGVCPDRSEGDVGVSFRGRRSGGARERSSGRSPALPGRSCPPNARR